MTLPAPADFAAYDTLTDATRICLWHAASMLYDELEQDARDAAQDKVLPWLRENFVMIGFADALPRQALAGASWEVVHDFMRSYDAVIWKLGNGPLSSHICSSTMEELAMRALIERAKTLAEEESDIGVFGFDVDLVDLDEVLEVVFQDLDHEMLFMPQLDGIEHDTPTLTEMGVADLRWRAWTTPFPSAPDRGHPMTWARDAPTRADQDRS